MLYKKAPRLAAAFVVTISAGCGSATSVQPDSNPPKREVGPENPDGVPNLGSVQEGFVRGDDGKCFIRHAANPPWMEPADCDTQKAIPEAPKPPDPTTSDVTPVDPKPPETPVAVDDSSLPEAPKGWKVDKDPSGVCRARVPSSSCPKGALCNPPPPRTVKCPKNLPKKAEDPAAL